MIARIRADLRNLRRWMAWVRRVRSGDPDPLLVVSSLDPGKVGRQERFGAAILDTAAWLEASGWADVEAGERQVYASYLLERRAAYENQGAAASPHPREETRDF